MANDLKELFSLALLNGKVRWFHFKEWLFVVRRYYANSLFFRIDLSLLSHYFRENPFLLSKRFLMERGEKDCYTYGETPLRVFEQMAKELELKVEDSFYELGSGRGRGCFWMHCFVGCKVVGIDYLPHFIKIANEVKEKYQLKEVKFLCEDFFESSLNEATVLYFYEICMDEKAIRRMIKRFEELPKGTKIVTVSFPLNEYLPSTSYRVYHIFKGIFDWGEGEVFLHRKER